VWKWHLVTCNTRAFQDFEDHHASRVVSLNESGRVRPRSLDIDPIIMITISNEVNK
jgi:hypothetical protein